MYKKNFNKDKIKKNRHAFSLDNELNEMFLSLAEEYKKNDSILYKYESKTLLFEDMIKERYKNKIKN